MAGHSLVSDALQTLKTWISQDPLWCAAGAAVLWGILYGFFRWRLKRDGLDVAFLAAIGAALLAFVGICLWTLAHSSGYRLL